MPAARRRQSVASAAASPRRGIAARLLATAAAQRPVTWPLYYENDEQYGVHAIVEGIQNDEHTAKPMDCERVYDDWREAVTADPIRHLITHGAPPIWADTYRTDLWSTIKQAMDAGGPDMAHAMGEAIDARLRESGARKPTMAHAGLMMDISATMGRRDLCDRCTLAAGTDPSGEAFEASTADIMRLLADSPNLGMFALQQYGVGLPVDPKAADLIITEAETIARRGDEKRGLSFSTASRACLDTAPHTIDLGQRGYLTLLSGMMAHTWREGYPDPCLLAIRDVAGTPYAQRALVTAMQISLQDTASSHGHHVASCVIAGMATADHG